MISGITAAQDLVRPNSGGNGGALLGSADFVNGVYSWGDATFAASDVVDRTDWIGADGLAVPGQSAAGAQLLGQFASALANCQFTAVIEVEILGDDFRSYVLTIDDTEEQFAIEIRYWDDWEVAISDGNLNPILTDDAHAIGNGIHKIAVTRIDNKMSLSVDGNPVASDGTSSELPVSGSPMTNFYLGGWDNFTAQAINIRSLAIYDPQDNSALPSLSAA